MPTMSDAGDFVAWTTIFMTLGLIGVRVMFMFLGGVFSE